MKTAQLLVVWTVVLASITGASGNLRAQSSEIQWQSDVGEAIELASRTDRLVLLHFQADWCRPCQHLETFVFNNPLVTHRFEDRVVPVKIDVDLNPDLVKEHAVTSIPTDVVMTPSGRVLIKQASPKTADDYARMLDRILVAKRQADRGHQNTLAQNIDHITGNAIVDPTKVAKSSGFTPDAPTHTMPELPHHANQLARQFAGRTSTPSTVELASGNSGNESGMLRPVAATEQDLEQRQSSNDFVPPKRITNNTSGPMTPQFNSSAIPATSSTRSPAATEAGPSATRSTDDLAGKLNQLLAQRAQPDAGDAVALPSPHADQKTSGPLEPLTNGAGGIGQPGRGTFGANDFVPPKRGTGTEPQGNTQAGFPTTREMSAKPDSGGQSGGLPGTRAAATAAPFAPSVDATAPQPPANPSRNGAPALGAQVSRSNAATNQTTESKQPRLALHGMCPVTLLEKSTWVKGDASIGCIHRGRIYLFASREAFEKFKSDPDRYSPLLAGYDPVIYHEQGRLVDGKESLGVFMGNDEEQSVVLFSSPETVQKFQADPQRYLQTIHQAMRAADSVGNGSGTLHR